MQNNFDGWVPVIDGNGAVFYGKNGQVSQWEPPFPGWVLTRDPYGVLKAVHAVTRKKVYSFQDIQLENLKIKQEADLELQLKQHAAERANYQPDPALLAIHEPAVNPFPETGRYVVDLRLRSKQPSGKIIWTPVPTTNLWKNFLSDHGDYHGYNHSKSPPAKIIWGRADGINLWNLRVFSDGGGDIYDLDCGIMDVADIRVFLPEMVSPDAADAAELKKALAEVDDAYNAAHARIGHKPYRHDNPYSGDDLAYYARADRKARAAAEIEAKIEAPGWVLARPYQTFAYLDFMYNRGTQNELTYFVPSSQSNFEDLIAKGYRRIKMLNGEYQAPVYPAIIITMLMRDNGSIYYRTADGNEVLMSCIPFERERDYRYIQPKKVPGAAAPAHRSPATASRSCWPFCRRSGRVLPAEAEGGRNRNKRRNRKQRTIKKHKNNKHNKHNKHKKRSTQQQSTR